MLRWTCCVVLLGAVGCAHGSDEVDPGPTTRGAGGTGGGGGLATSSSSGATGGSPTGSGGSMTTSTGGGGGAGGCDFSDVNTCSSSMLLGNLAGDADEPPVTLTGTSSEWFQILIEETVGSVFGEALSYTVTLQSPAGMDYDLIVYQGEQDSPPNCNATPKFGLQQGSVEVVHDSWNDDQGLGGEDDSVFLNIHVLHVSGEDCGAQYTLTVEGHT